MSGRGRFEDRNLDLILTAFLSIAAGFWLGWFAGAEDSRIDYERRIEGEIDRRLELIMRQAEAGIDSLIRETPAGYYVIEIPETDGQ